MYECRYSSSSAVFHNFAIVQYLLWITPANHFLLPPAATATTWLNQDQPTLALQGGQSLNSQSRSTQCSNLPITFSTSHKQSHGFHMDEPSGYVIRSSSWRRLSPYSSIRQRFDRSRGSCICGDFIGRICDGLSSLSVCIQLIFSHFTRVVYLQWQNWKRWRSSLVPWQLPPWKAWRHEAHDPNKDQGLQGRRQL